MEFGLSFRGWICTLHTRVSARFLLHSLTPALLILFSAKVTPLSCSFSFSKLSHFSVPSGVTSLASTLVGPKFPASAYVDDGAVVGTETADLPVLDEAVQDFEAGSSAILNRNRKSVNSQSKTSLSHACCWRPALPPTG
jgi:hypothetical protein